VHREGREREEKRRDLLAKSVYKDCMLYLNIIQHSYVNVAPERG
jgi:hypothetical protein